MTYKKSIFSQNLSDYLRKYNIQKIREQEMIEKEKKFEKTLDK